MSLSLIACLSFMVYLFGTKSIENLQLRFWIEDAVCILLLFKSWTKRSTWEHLAWYSAKDTRGLFAGCLWPRGQSLLLRLQYPQLDATGWPEMQRGRNFRQGLPWGSSGWEMPGLHRVSVFSWRRAGVLRAAKLVPSVLGEIGPALEQSLPAHLRGLVWAHFVQC